MVLFKEKKNAATHDEMRGKKHFMAVTYVGAVLENVHAALIKCDEYFSV